MNRKQRKQLRRAKRKAVKQTDVDNRLAWRFARLMTKQKSDKQLNVKLWCERCMEHFCNGFDGVEVFCSDCYYKGDPRIPDEGLPIGCQKQCVGGQICQSCAL